MSCSRRNHRSTRDGGIHRNNQRINVISDRPAPSPITGDRKIKTIVFVQPAGIIAPNPALATAAPAYPPISACDELVGSPKNHVIRSQMMAPVRPPKITANDTILRSIMPAPTVLATAVPNVKAAMKLKKAAHATALPGDRTRVETTV